MDSSQRQISVATDLVASREVRCSSECCVRAARRSWVGDACLDCDVSVEKSRSVCAPSATYLRKWFHPLVSFRPLQSSPSRVHSRPSSQECLPWGCGPASRRQSGAIMRRASSPSPARPRRFSRPRRFPALSTLWVYFAPQPRTGFALQGFVPPAQPLQLVAESCPLVVVDLALSSVAQ